jgi:hypothetical protein
MLGQRKEGRLRHRIGGRRPGLDGLPSPHRADVNDAALRFLINHPLRRGLGQEEKRFVDDVVLMIILARVFEEWSGEELPGGIDEVVKRRSSGKLCGKAVHLGAIIQIHGLGGNQG